MFHHSCSGDKAPFPALMRSFNTSFVDTYEQVCTQPSGRCLQEEGAGKMWGQSWAVGSFGKGQARARLEPAFLCIRWKALM